MRSRNRGLWILWLLLLISPAAQAGLVASWNCNATTGNAVDASGNANTLTMTGGASFGTGKYGNGCVFSGTAQYGDAGNGVSLRSFGTGGLSVAAWVFVNAAPSLAFPAMVEKGNGDWTAGGAATGFYLSVGYQSTGADIHWAVGDGGGQDLIHHILAFGSIIGAWTHVVAIADPVGGSPLLRLFVNKTQVATVARVRTGSIDDATNSLNVGRWRQFTRHLNGTVDSVQLYNHALSQPEIDAHYAMRPRRR